MKRRSSSFRSLTRRLSCLEDRIAPAVSYAFDRVTGILTATGDASNDVIVVTRNQSELFEVNGVPVLANGAGKNGLPGLVPVKDIRGVVFNGGAGDDLINVQLGKGRQNGAVVFIDYDGKLSSRANFIFTIHGGTGNDTITGSMYADHIIPGSGNDVVLAGGGENLIEGTWEELAGNNLDGGRRGGVNVILNGVTDPSIESSMNFDTTTVNLVRGSSTISLKSVYSINLTFEDVNPPELKLTNSIVGAAGNFDVQLDLSSNTAASAARGQSRLRVKNNALITIVPPPNSDPYKSLPISLDVTGANVTLTQNGSDGNDTFTIDPGARAALINGGAGNDVVRSNHGGLNFTQGQGQFLVAGKAPVTLAGVETVQPLLWLQGDGGQAFLLNNKVTITSKVGATPDSIVYTISNGGSQSLENVSIKPIRCELKRTADPRQTSPGVAITEIVYPDDVSLDDLARGVEPGTRDIIFTIPVLEVGQSVTVAIKTKGTGADPNRVAFLDLPFALDATIATVKFSDTPTRISTNFSVGRVNPNSTSSVIGLADSSRQEGTFVAASANGALLTLSELPNVDPTVSTVTPGLHLYFNGRMVDVTPDGKASGNGMVTGADVDFAGGVIVFASGANNLTADAPSPFDDIFIAGPNGIVKITRGIGAPFADGPSRNPRVSGDASYIVFESKASNLVPGVVDANNDWDLFVYDVAAKSTQYVAGAPTGGLQRSMWDLAKGKGCIAFVAEPPGNIATLNIWDGADTKSIPLTGWSFGASNAGVRLADNGSTLAFWTDASVADLIGKPDTNGAFDLLKIDTATFKVTPLSLNQSGTATGNGATPVHAVGDVDLSCDGSSIFFTTAVPIDGTGVGAGPHIRVVNGGTATAIAPLSVGDIDGDGLGLRASPCGKKIKWDTMKDLRSSGAPDFKARETFVWNQGVDEFDLVSVDQNGNPSGGSTSHVFADDGRTVLFTTSAKLVPEDTDALPDHYWSLAHVSLSRSISGGVRVATGDVNGDGTADIIITNSATGTVVASRPVRSTDWLFLIGGAGDDTLTIDFGSGITGLSGIHFDGGPGADLLRCDDLGSGEVVKYYTISLEDVIITSSRTRTNILGVEGIDFGPGSHSNQVSLYFLRGDDAKIAVTKDGGQVKTVYQPSKAGQVSPSIWCGKTDHFRIITGNGNDTVTVSGELPIGLLTIDPGQGNDVVNAITYIGPCDLAHSPGDDTVAPGLGNSTIGFGHGDTIDATAAGTRRIKAEMYCEDIRFTYGSGSSFQAQLLGIGSDDTVSFAGSNYPVTIDLDSTVVQTITPVGHKLELSGPIGEAEGSSFGDKMNIKFRPEYTRKVVAQGGLATPPDNVGIDAEGNSIYLERTPTGFNYYRSRTDTGFISVDGPADVSILNKAAPANPVPEINGGAVQRSRVGAIVVPFNYQPEFKAGPENAFQLKTAGGQAVPFTTEVFAAGGLMSIIITPGGPFVENGSLIDGRYVLTIDGTQFIGGLPAGGDVVFNFHRLFGDSDGNASVTAADFAAFRLVYGTTGPSMFDFDNNGSVSAADFNAFRLRYGVAI
jgi:hypothetical protein